MGPSLRGQEQPARSNLSDPNRVEGEYILTLRDANCLARAHELLLPYGGKKVSLVAGTQYLFRLSTDPGPDAIKAALAQDACVRAVQPNFVYRAL